jgi:hypothetical protein
MSSDDDTVRTEQSDDVPIEIFDSERTWPKQPLVTQPVQYDQIIEEIDQSDGVPLLLPGMDDDTEPSIPTTRVWGKALLPS